MEVILDKIPFEPDLDALRRRLRLTPGTPYAQDLENLASDARLIARPKALCRVAYVEARGDRTVVISGVTFTSRVLRVNLEGVHRVFVYAATCGTELQEWAASLQDVLQRFWADAIQEMALHAAARALVAHIGQHYRPGKTSTMAPGSLGDWPLREQRPLFRLLGDIKTQIGIELLDSLLMVPFKSISGIRFPTEVQFESCMLCPRQDCPGRRAAYDRRLYDQRYRPEAEIVTEEDAR